MIYRALSACEVTFQGWSGLEPTTIVEQFDVGECFEVPHEVEQLDNDSRFERVQA